MAVSSRNTRGGDGVSHNASLLASQQLTCFTGFYINLPIGAVSTVILSGLTIPDGFVRTTAKSKTKLSVLWSLDPIGFVLFAGFTVTLFMALQWGGSVYEWSSHAVIGALCASAGFLASFAAWERFVGENAMFPFSMLRKRVVWASCLTMFLLQGSALIYLYYLPIYFQAVKGTTPFASGLYNSPGIGSQMLLAAVSGVLGMFSLKWNWRLLLLTFKSGEDGILPPVGPCKRDSRRCWVGLDVDSQT